nr:retrotransposon protein, putative, Ty1-copia subclass [Tanacetum cinerariifolium]
MILAIAALRNIEIHQMDVKMAFLNGDLEEEIYMNQTKGFIAPGQEGKDTSSGYVILCLYVDDMLIVGSNDKMIKSTKDMLKLKFDMKDMGDSGQARIPIDTNMHLSKNKGLGVAQLEYSRIIGMLMYLMTCTRPDLAYAVSRLCRYTSNPSYAHWKAITRVLHYLRYNRDYGLHYDRHPAVIKGYIDANWISEIKDFTLGGAVISWKSSKKTVIAKSTMESKFIALDKCVKNQLGKKIKVVRSDRGVEYVSPFTELCAKHETRHKFTAPYSPQQNGITERKNRTLKEMVTAMLISSGISQDTWGEAILMATYLLNKLPRKDKEETPYELWMGRKPSYQYLRVWGRLAKVDVPAPKAQKIGPKYVDCIFIGYAKNNSAYRFIVYESKKSRYRKEYNKRQRDDNDLQDERQDKTKDEEVGPRRSKRARNEKSFGLDFVSFMVENEPTSYEEALTSLEGYKWIFKKKMIADGTIDKYKARLVIKGFRQREEEEIYMNQPEGFIAPGQEGKVCTLVKSLYGLKQAPKQWRQKFDHTMLESGFKINKCDKCVYVKDTSSGYVILCLYVGDMLIVGSNDKMIKSTKHMLKLQFDMKDMGLADVILRIKIIRTQNGLVLSQAHYVDKILNIHNARNSGQARTLIDTISRLSRHPAVIEGYSDANWISDIKDSRSTSGYVFTLGGAAISWKSSRKTVIAKHEFTALYSPQQNGIVERKNRTLKEMVTAMLISSETGSSSRLDDEVVQDKRQRDDNDLQDERQDQIEGEEVEPRRSEKARNGKSFGPDVVSFMVENEPTSYREAVTSLEGQQWREAIKSEIQSILQNHT